MQADQAASRSAHRHRLGLRRFSSTRDGLALPTHRLFEYPAEPEVPSCLFGVPTLVRHELKRYQAINMPHGLARAVDRLFVQPDDWLIANVRHRTLTCDGLTLSSSLDAPRAGTDGSGSFLPNLTGWIMSQFDDASWNPYRLALCASASRAGR